MLISSWIFVSWQQGFLCHIFFWLKHNFSAALISWQNPIVANCQQFSLVLCVRCWWCMPRHWTGLYLQDFSVVGVNQELDVKADGQQFHRHVIVMIPGVWHDQLGISIFYADRTRKWMIGCRFSRFASDGHAIFQPQTHWKIPFVSFMTLGAAMEAGNDWWIRREKACKLGTYYVFRCNSFKWKWRHLWKNKSIHYSTQQISADVKMRKTSQDLQVAVSRF